MRKQGKHLLEEKVKELSGTLKEIREITERNQYNNSQVAFRLIQEKIKKVL